MHYTESKLREAFEGRFDDVQDMERLWLSGRAPQDGVQGFLRNTAKSFERLANCAALLDATRQSRQWFGQAARFYLESIDAARVRRDICSRSKWESEPRRVANALHCALLSHDQSRIDTAADVALGMDECYVDVFKDDYTDFPALYYNAKSKAAVTVNDGQAPVFLDELRTGISRLSDPSPFWETVPTFYQAVLDRDEQTADDVVETLLDYYDDDPSAPAQYVLHTVGAFVVLARRHDLAVSVESERVPEALVRDEIPADDVELPVDDDLIEIDVLSSVDRFELERDEDNTPVIAGYVYHPGDVEIHASDVPERAAGRLLADDWIEAALSEAEWRDHYDDELVADATAAFEEGTLGRKLVVLQDRTDGPLFDDSLAELPIDSIDIQKGAGFRK